MPVAIVSGPGNYEIKMAYNPIIINVVTTGVTPVIFVDVYFAGVYYKTVSANSPDAINGGNGSWAIDISDVCQEFMRSEPPLFATLVGQEQRSNGSMVMCTVKVRGSSVANGITYPDSPIPLQATMDNAAAGGGGMSPQGNPSWVVINGALQLGQEPNPETFLQTNVRGNVAPGRKVYNMYTNPRLAAGKNDYMHLPVYLPLDYYAPPGQPYIPQSTYLGILVDNWYYFSPFPLNVTNNAIYYLPAGPKEALAAFTTKAAGAPALNFNTIKSYRLVLDVQGNPLVLGTTIWISRPIRVRSGCGRRFRFLNWLGHFESISMDEATVDFGVTAARWQQYNPGDFTSHARANHSQRRYNVRANDEITVTGYFEEGDMPFVEQFLSSPTMYEETQATGGQLYGFLRAMVMLDCTVQTAKVDERWIYEVTVKLQPSVERITMRS